MQAGTTRGAPTNPPPTLVQALTPSEEQLKDRASCVQFICKRLQQASERPRVRIEPFGSSASGLILPGSDLDLGLHGYWNSSTPVHLLPRQAKIDILTAMDKIIWRRRMALNGKVRSKASTQGLLGCSWNGGRGVRLLSGTNRTL